jgi:hypothetical protein
VDINSGAECLNKRLVLAKVGEKAQLNLAVVEANEFGPFTCSECLADLPSHLGANRNILEIRLVATQPSRGSHRLVEACMNPAIV